LSRLPLRSRLCENDSTRTYLRRNVLKAGALIGAASVLPVVKVSAASWLSAQAAQPIENFGNLKRGSNMPLARIDIRKDASAELVRVISEAVYKAMVDVANVPVHDKFQVITRHAQDEIIYPEEGYLGLNYTRDLIIIQVTWVGGRSIEVKKKFFHQIADDIHAKGGVRKEDVWINLIDTSREDWSFGNGEMQYGPK
jgi:4-oxalocrotonate tautomerase